MSEPTWLMIDVSSWKTWAQVYVGIGGLVLVCWLGWRFGWDAQARDFKDPQWWVRTVALAAFCSALWPFWLAGCLLFMLVVALAA